MAEYIERDKAVSELVHDYAYAAADIIKAIPAADVALVVHGRWEEVIEPNVFDTYGRPSAIYRCTSCEFIWTNKYAVKKYFKHCPNCGAKMDLPQEN